MRGRGRGNKKYNYYNNNYNNYYDNDNNYYNNNNYHNNGNVNKGHNNNYRNNYYNNNYNRNNYYNNKNDNYDDNEYYYNNYEDNYHQYGKNNNYNNYNNINKNKKNQNKKNYYEDYGYDQNNNYKDKGKKKFTNNSNNNKNDNDDEIKKVKDSFKTKEIKFLKDLKQIMKMQETEKNFNEFFNKEKLQNKFKEIFGIKEDAPEEVYKNLFNLFYKLIDYFKSLSNLRPNEEKKNIKDVKNIFDDVFDVLVLLIQKNYIKKNESKEMKSKAIEEFTNLINNIPYSLLYNMSKFIDIYNIEEELKDFIISFKDFKELSNKYNKISLLYILKKLKLQDKYNFSNFEITQEKSQDFNNLIAELYGTYNISNKMLNELNEYIRNKVEKNYFDLGIIRKIFKRNKDNLEFNESIKQFIFDYLLSFDASNVDDKNLKKYYSFLINNKISHFDKNNILSVDNINSLLTKNYYISAFYLIKIIDKKELEKINDNLLDKIIDNFSSDKKVEIKEFLEIFPNKIKNVMNHFVEKNELKELLGILKYIKKVEELNDEVAYRIDKKKYHGIILNKFKRNFEEKKQYNSIVEFVTKSEDYYKIFFPIFEKLILEKNQEIAYRMLYTVIDTAKNKNYHVFPSTLKKYKYNKEDLLEFKDVFGPLTDGCLAFTKEQINVIFIDKVEDFKSCVEKYFDKSKSEYIGFDSEWVDKINCKEKTETAIVQLSDYDGKNILLLDMINLCKDENFVLVFKDIFINKKLIGFDLKDDLINLPNEIMCHLQEKNELIDLKDIYRIITFENPKSFSDLCNEFFGNPLCKYEQCSNWENRPLRESQLHYAALDAIYCCLIYKKLMEYKNK